jgi:NAD(P)-dependent dehydrogenase (short-subunit alcohol dehydrogenase family)
MELVLRALFASVLLSLGGNVALGAPASNGTAGPRAGEPPVPDAPIALITGANRGIGLALTEALAAKGWKVVATAREPSEARELTALAASDPDVTVEQLDLANDAQVQALAAKYRGRSIDVLVNNAGVLGDNATQRMPRFDYANFEQVMHVNVFAQLQLSVALLDSVASSRQKKIVAISSLAGSVFNNQQARDNYFYRASKSALNMTMRTLQNDVRDRGVVVGIFHPGAVDTVLNRGFRNDAPKPPGILTPEESAAALVKLIERLGPEMGGRFYSYTGQELPW